MIRILIVDDNEQNLYMLQVLLAGSGYEVESAGDGAEALEKARSDPPDMIISDILMPVMDGFALCCEWKKDEGLKAIPFVFYTTTYTDPKDEEFALSLGAERFIVKPQEPDVFVGMLWEVLENHEAGRLVAPREPVEEEVVYFREYNEALIRKLENKMLQLEEANQALEQDITERKRAEEALRESEEHFRSLVASASDTITMTDLDGNTLFINEAGKTLHGADDMDELIGRNAFSFIAEESLESAREGMEIVLREGVAKNREYFLVRDDGTKVPVEMTVSVIRDADGKPFRFMAITRDITERKWAEEELQRTLERLREALGGIVQTVSLTVEMRDPYTAGHQRRVANLARAIANGMGLPQEQIDGIRMAGLIHDLGKISIPAEILSKPTRLTEFEWGIVKGHPEVGYDILKKIEFPWPVAQMVLQHHERMDGSGYPQGLSGEEIILEARILGVADVVEAMASFRPYRPALGIDKALEEVSQNKGILYDAEVVDACLKLFTEDGFAFE